MHLKVTTTALLAALVPTCIAYAQPAVTDGSQIYATNCAECHGENLVSPGTIFDIKQLGPNDKPRFMTVLTEGKGQMPAFVGTLTDEQIESLWLYIRSKSAN
jgi:mono/diheme cytochrome c family protein